MGNPLASAQTARAAEGPRSLSAPGGLLLFANLIGAC